MLTRLRLYLLLLSFIAAFVSCSVQRSAERPSQFQVDINNSPRIFIDPEIQKSSLAIHSFLLGQLSYADEELAAALDNYERASELMGKPVPFVDVRLAELYVRTGKLEVALKESRKALSVEPDDTYNQLLVAGLEELLKNYSEAEASYLKIIESKPLLFEPYVLLSGMYFYNHQYDKGIAVLERFLKSSPSEIIAHYYLGRAYEMRSDLVIAEKHFRAAYKLDRDNLELGQDVVRILLKARNYEQARIVCREILEKDPNNAMAQRIMTELSDPANHIEEAIRQLKAVEAQEDSYANVRFKLALLEIEKHDFRQAIRELLLVLAADPNHSQARYYLASMYAGSGRKKEAVEELFNITSDQSMYAKSRTFAAFILRQQGDLERAEESMRAALAAEPNNKSILFYLVSILRDMRKLEAAEKLLQGAADAEPENDKLLFSYAIVLHEMGREDEALAMMQKVIAINPKHSDALNYVAYDLAERGKELETAIELINRALALKPNDGYYLDTYGWILYLKGSYNDAEEILSRATQLTGDDVVIMGHYADVLLRVGKDVKALDVYRAAIERARDSNDKDQAEAIGRIGKKLEELSKSPINQSRPLGILQ